MKPLELICEKYNPVLLVHHEPKTFDLPPNARAFVDEKFTGKHPDGDHWNHKNYSNVMSQLWSIKTVSEIFDAYRKNKITGSFILINENSNNTVAAGIING